MPRPEERLDTESLLADAAWLKRLAVRLVGTSGADDLVQETYVAALERPPRDASRLRGWLARVLRNVAFSKLRREHRRRRRELLASRPEGVDSASEAVLARAELRRAVVEAVLGLEEPYRSAVILRYFEELEIAGIATRAGVPESTVRTWLSRASEMLRGRLDALHRSDRRAWSVALVAGLALETQSEASAAIAASTSSAAALSGSTGSAAASAFLSTGSAIAMHKTVAAVIVTCSLLAGLAVGVVVGPEVLGEPSAEADLAAASRERLRDLQARYEQAVDELRALRSRTTSGRTNAAVATTPAAATSRSGPGPLAPVEIPEGEYRNLAEMLAAMQAPEYADGGESITGLVLDYTTHEPVEGVIVHVRPSLYWEKSSTGFPAPRHLDSDLESSLIDWLSVRHFERSTARQAITDASGAFEITGLAPDRLYEVEAHRNGCEIDAAPGSTNEDVLPGSHVDFLAKRVVTFPVSIRFEDGTVPSKAMVYWTAGRGTRKWDTWYPHDPVISLRPDSYVLYAKAGPSWGYKSEETLPLEVLAGAPPEGVVLTLLERRAILGRVVFAPGQASTTAHVYLHRMSGASPPDPVTLLASRASTITHSRDEFTFRFTDIENGVYALAASRDGFVVDASTTVEVADGIADVVLEIPELSPREYTVVHVLEPNGEPALDASVSVRYPSGRTTGTGATVRAAPGTFLVLDNRGSTGEHRLEASSMRYGRTTVDYTPEGQEITVRFDEPASLEVAVGGYRGSGLEGRLRVAVQDGGPAARTAAGVVLLGPSGEGVLLDGDGTAVLEPLGTGEHVVDVWLESRSSVRRVLAQVPVQLSSGVNRVVVPLPTLHPLVVRAPGLQSGTAVTVASITDSELSFHASSFVGSGGVATFEFVPAGRHVVFVRGESVNRRLEVDVPAAGEVVIE